MKKLFVILAAVLLTTSMFAQSPEKMSYQAVIRNTSNNLVTSASVGMKISILQGSAFGTVVYAETQTPTTNANGLVSIEIGAGIVISGDFSTIDWANDSYFIKTETDPTGGTSYSIICTSQLLSVPYALHAKTAETITGKVTETDPVFTAWDKDYTDLINRPTAPDGSETKVTAGTNVMVTGAGTTASPYVINASSGSASHYVGELYGGGVVFWCDHTGNHGLIVSMIDLSISQAWSNIASTFIGTTNDWNGANNTTAITGQSGHKSSAAKLCEDYTNANYGTGTYSDWYLPSVYELNDLWNNIKAVTKALANDGNSATTPLVRNYYWSSSEHDVNYAWLFYFNSGSTDYTSKNLTYFVRAVRAF